MAKTINPRQEIFCQLFATDPELLGNATEAYLRAYHLPPSKYQVAASNAHKLLKIAEIVKRVNDLLSAEGFNNENVDKQHLFLLNQHVDFKSKLGAIKEYNELKRRINKDHPPPSTIIVNLIRYGDNTPLSVRTASVSTPDPPSNGERI